MPVPPGDVAAVVAHCTPRLVVTDGADPLPAAVTAVGPPDLGARGEVVAAVGNGLAHPRARSAVRRATTADFFYHPGRATRAAATWLDERLTAPHRRLTSVSHTRTPAGSTVAHELAK